jgi:hypothetical protein
MKKILILATSALCIFSAKADDDYATIVRYLGENGHYIIPPEDVAKVRAFMKAHGYQHVSEIPAGSFAAATPAAQPTATEAQPTAAQAQPTVAEIKPPSGRAITQIVVPSATPVPGSTTGSASIGSALLTAIIAVYCLPLLIALGRHHRQLVPLAILNSAFGWTVIGWIGCLAWAFAQGKK